MKRESFVFYLSFHEALKPLEPEQYKNVVTAINEYALYGTEPELTGIENSFFLLIRPQLEANNRRYENGKKGGRPPEEKPEPDKDEEETEKEPKEL